MLNVRVPRDQQPVSVSVRSDESLYFVNPVPEEALCTSQVLINYQAWPYPKCVIYFEWHSLLQCQVQVAMGTVLAGFGKGKFGQMEDGSSFDDPQLLLFHLRSGSDLVFFDNKLVEVQAVLTQRLAAGSADVKVAFHKTERVAEQWTFTKDCPMCYTRA